MALEDIEIAWNSLAKIYPEVEKIKTRQEWLIWIENHPTLKSPSALSLWDEHEKILLEKKPAEKKERDEEKEEHEKHQHLPHGQETYQKEKKEEDVKAESDKELQSEIQEDITGGESPAVWNPPQEPKRESHEDQQQSQPSVQQIRDFTKRIEQIQSQETQTFEQEFVRPGSTAAPKPSAAPSMPRPSPPRASQLPGIPRGLGNAARAAANLGRQAALGAGRAAAGALAGVGWPVFAAIGAVLLITIIIVIILGGGEGGGSIPSGGDVASCTFYRGSDTTPGLKFRIQEWPTLITEASSKVGVPASVLAGILRIESPNRFYTPDPDFIKNDFDNNSSGIAYGTMQFYPPTFRGVFRRHVNEMKELFNKTDVSIDTTITQDHMESNNLLRIYSVRDSVIAAAFKIRDDVGIGSPYDKSAIERIVIAYFTQCAYTSNGKTYNYCDDLWQSVSSCQQGSPGSRPADTSSILGWTENISSVLEIGPDIFIPNDPNPNQHNTDYDRVVQIITNGTYTATRRTGELIDTSPRGLYWCTNLVIDSYNLAGKAGLGLNHQAVVNMNNFWKTSSRDFNSGYIYLDYLNDNHQSVLSALNPGFAIFFESVPGVFTGNEHTAIIKDKHLDSNGNGWIETYDSNTNSKTHRYPIFGWNVKNQRYTLVGFGGVN